MKLLKALFLLMLFQTVGIAQSSCSFAGGSGAGGAAAFNGIKFFSNENCDHLVFNVDFVFLRRDDKSGTHSENSPVVAALIDEINQKLANIRNKSGCYSGEYTVDSKIRLNVEINYIDNIDAFDYYGKAVSLGSSYSKTSFCPGGVPSKWPELYAEVSDYNTANPNSFNIFFVENDALLSYLETSIANGETDANHIPWTDPNNIDIFSGCSSGANSYNSSVDEWVIQINYYSEYLKRLHYGNTYYGPLLSNPYTNEEILAWEIDDYESLIIHEMGHSIMDQGHTCGCDNIMIGEGCAPEYVGNTESLSYDQLENLHRVLSTTNNHKYVDCNQLSESTCDTYVESDATVSKPLSIYGDLIVKENATLTVKSQIYFSENSELIVEENGKLIVDNGLLTNGCGPSWKGIKVRRGNQGYDVEIINNSIIENTSEAAVNMFASGGWILGEGNARVNIDGSTFNNCHRMVAMGSTSSAENLSIIKGNTQNGGKYGITNWNCSSVDVIDNTFNTITNECIVTEHGQFTIDDNTFNGGRADILFANTNPGFGSEIVSNEFNGLNTGIRALGASLGQHLIHFNQFYTGEFDIFMDGDNNYRVKNNDFTSDFACTSIDNGIHSNEIYLNDFSGNFIGLMPLGMNENYVFYENCYSTSFADNWITGQINDPIANGETFGAANNCFTHNGNANHPTYDLAGTPSSFEYAEPNDTNDDCRDAVKAASGVTIEDDYPSVGSPCATTGSGSGPPPPSTQFNPCNPPKISSNTWNAILWLENKIEEIENDPNLTDEQKTFFKDFYNRCLQRVKWQYIQILIKEKKYAEIRNYLQGETINDAIPAIYATYIAENDLVEARNYINSLTSQDPFIQDFIAIQLINLDRLDAGRVYTPSSSELQTLEIIAARNHPYAGYAKALLYWFTEEILVSEIPDLGSHNNDPRNNSLDEVTYSIYPNPFTENLNVRIEDSHTVNLEIVDIFGKTWKSIDINGQTSVNSSNWPNGVYLVTLRLNNSIVKQEKIVLAR